MKALLEKIRKILRSRRTRQLLTRAVSGVAAIVVFITTYALVLPAITMEQDAFCGIPEHQHIDACYEERLVCEIPEGEEHQHDASCYEKFLICEKEVHVHSTECYQQDSSAVVSTGSGAAASTALGAYVETDAYETGVSEFAAGAAVMDSAAGGESITEEPAEEEASSAQAATEEFDEMDPVSDGTDTEGTDGAGQTDAGTAASEPVSGSYDNGSNGLEDTEQESSSGEGDTDLAADSNQDAAGTDLENQENQENGSSENIDADTTNPEPAENEDSEEDSSAADTSEGDDDELTKKVNEENEDLPLNPEDSMDINESIDSDSDIFDASDRAVTDSAGVETEDADSVTGTEEAANAATTNVLPENVETEKLSSGFVPELDSIEFSSVLNKHTDFFYFHPEEGQEIPASSAEVTEWKKVKNGLFGSTKLESTDLVKMYLSYTVPAGALNETNQVARYRLPSNIHLTDDQIIAINATENGMSALYADAAVKEDESAANEADENTADDAGDEANAEGSEADNRVESIQEDAGTASGTDEEDEAGNEAVSDALEQAQDENAANYQKYLGAEAIEGTRTPDETLKEGAQEYISAIVKAENVFDEEGLYGEKGAFLGQDLIFIFTPYSIEKNQTIYNADGDPLSAGEKITGWFACDFNMSQIDWVEEDTDLDNSTVEKTAEVVFVEKDSEKNVKEISRKLKLVDTTEDQNDVANGGETAAAVETAAAAETAAVAETATAAETAAAATTASETAATDEAALASTGNTSEQAAPEDNENEPFKSGTLIADGDGYRITLDYTEEAKIPEKAELSVREITAETDREAYETCLEQAGQQVAADEKTSVDQKASRFFDIEILVKNTDSEGKEETRKIEPAAPVSVNIQILDNPVTEDTVSVDKEISQSEPAVLHFAEEGVEQIDSTVKTSEEQEDNKDRSGSGKTEPATEISFEAESFSIYGVVYTVDFEYSVNGKMYQFSLPGGGFVSFTDLVEVLGIIGDTNGADIDKFITDIQKAEFSDPSLVWVGKAEEDTTVGALKDGLGLLCEYSSELSEGQIEEINDATVSAGDWLLISLKPFKTEETLTITMMDGEAWTVMVTDAQISADVLTAGGETYTVTLEYGDDAGIPDNAGLRVTEIAADSDMYKEYLNASADKLGADSESISLARFFDIRIVETVEGEERNVEPEAPVKVTIALKEELREENSLSVVHFLPEGPQRIDDAQLNELDDVEFTAESFSVYGVITMPAPESLNDIDGHTAKIGNRGYYLGDQNLTNENPQKINKVNNAANAAEYTFEAVNGGYQIYTLVAGAKKYINFSGFSGNSCSVSLADSPQVLAVSSVNGHTLIGMENNGTWYYLNQYNGEGGAGFAGYASAYTDYAYLTLSYTQPATQTNKDYMVLVKMEKDGEDVYYIVLNDGMLEEVQYNPGDGFVTVENPMTWHYTGDHIHHNSMQVGFTGQALPSAYYYKYIDPSSQTGLNEDDSSNTTTDGTPDNQGAGPKITNRELWSTTALVYTADHKLRSGSNNSYYIGVTEKNGKLMLKGQSDASEAVEIFFADAVNVAPTDWARHVVNHIDISIDGTAAVDVPLAYGKYFDENGEVVMDVTSFQKLHLDEALVIDPDDLVVKPEDMKNSSISAYLNDGTTLDDAFYVTGYSANPTYLGESAQVRIEGAFKVAHLDGMTFQKPDGGTWPLDTVNVNAYNNDWWGYKEAVHQARLDNQVHYDLTVTKPVEFWVKLPVEDDQGNVVSYTQLYDADRKPLKITAYVAFSASFAYWDGVDSDYWNDPNHNEDDATYTKDGKTYHYTGNECPPIFKREYNDWVQWRQGYIATHNMSGMDFKLGGDSETETKIYAVEITKLVVDENGNRIKSYNAGRNTFHVYKNPSTDADPVKDLNVGAYTEQMDLTDYALQHSKSLSVGTEGMGTVYDYDVRPGLFYISEDPESVPQVITDTSGKAWNYKETYILTEYAWRNHPNDNYMHVSPTYSGGEEEYAAVPEILGDHYGYNGTDGPYTNDFLEFYVYNVYEAPKVDVPVTKTWDDFSSDEFDWRAQFKLQWAPVYPDETKPTVAFQDVSPERTVELTKAMMAAAADGTETPGQLAARTFTDLPKYGTDQNGNTFRYQYSLEEISYQVWNSATGVVLYEYSKDEGYSGEDSDTIYLPFYPHDAGENDSELEEENAADENYYISVENIKKEVRESKYIDINLEKRWDDSFPARDDTYWAEFELRRFSHTEYRDLSEMSDADRTADPVTVTIMHNGEVVSSLQAQPNMGLYLGGNFMGHSDPRSATFTANHPVRLANGSNTTTLTAQAGSNMSNAVVRTQEFFVVEDTVFTIGDGFEYLVADRPAQVLDTSAGTSPLPDHSFSQTIRLDSTNNWQTALEDLLVRETTVSGDNNNENVTCYEYYLVEKDSNPKGYAQYFRLNSDGTVSTTLSGDADHQIEADDSIVAVNGPANRLRVKKLWRGVPDNTGFPAITFTLYQTWADGNDGWVYENPDTHARYEHIELGGNALEWICPESLPATRLDGSTSRAVKYYVMEDERSGSVTNGGVSAGWKFYYYLTSEGQQTNAGHQGYFAAIRGQNILDNPEGGTITICNAMDAYMQMDIQKQFFLLGSDGSWDNVTANNDMKRGAILGFQVIRAVKAPDGKWLDARGNESDTPVWMDYGEEMLCGYDEDGHTVVSRGENDIFWLHDAGGDWHFRIENNEGDHSNVSAGGAGLPSYGFYIRNGEDLPVEYWYSFREIGVYKNLNKDPYPEWDWFSSVTPVNAYGPTGTMEAFPKAFHGQDGKRIANFQASDLIIDKDWIGEPTATKVYIKIWRTTGDGEPEDFTAVIADDIRSNRNWQYYVDDVSSVDLGRNCLVLDLDASGSGTAAIKVNRALLGALSETGSYQYYIQEIGYRDNQGVYRTNVNATFKPLYDHWVNGAYTDSPVQMNDYASNSITIAGKGQNRLKVTNSAEPSTSYTVTKAFYGAQSSTGGQSSVTGKYPTDGSKQVVVELQQRYRYEKTEEGVDYVSADNSTWVTADSEDAKTTWCNYSSNEGWQSAESASPTSIVLPLDKPEGSILSDEAWYGSAAAWTYTWEGLDVVKVVSNAENPENSPTAQLYYRAVEVSTPNWFSSVIAEDEQNGHKAVANGTTAAVPAKNTVTNNRKETTLNLNKEWTGLGAGKTWPDNVTIDYQLVQYFHLALADMSHVEDGHIVPEYSAGTIFKSVEMTTTNSGAATADSVHPQAIGLNVGKPADGSTVIANITGLPMYGFLTATEADVAEAAEHGVTLVAGKVYPVVYTYGAKETAVKRNDESIPFKEQTVEAERDGSVADAIAYTATLTNELVSVTVEKEWNGLTPNTEESATITLYRFEKEPEVVPDTTFQYTVTVTGDSDALNSNGTVTAVIYNEEDGEVGRYTLKKNDWSHTFDLEIGGTYHAVFTGDGMVLDAAVTPPSASNITEAGSVSLTATVKPAASGRVKVIVTGSPSGLWMNPLRDSTGTELSPQKKFNEYFDGNGGETTELDGLIPGERYSFQIGAAPSSVDGAEYSGGFITFTAVDGLHTITLNYGGGSGGDSNATSGSFTGSDNYWGINDWNNLTIGQTYSFIFQVGSDPTQYTVTATGVTSCSYSVTNNWGNGGQITVTFVPASADEEVVITATNSTAQSLQTGKRASVKSATGPLRAPAAVTWTNNTTGLPAGANPNTDELVDTIIFSGTTWSKTWTELPKYSEDGKEYVYYAYETAYTGASGATALETTYSMDEDGNWTVTNTPTYPDLGNLKVTKEVMFGSERDIDADRLSFTVGIFSDSAGTTRVSGQADQTITVQDGYGEATFTGLTAGSYYVYEIVDDEPVITSGTAATIDETNYTVTYTKSSSVVSNGETATAAIENTKAPYSLNVLKIDKNDSTKTLDGAVFQLNKLMYNAETQIISYAENSAVDVTTANGGTAAFSNLTTGYYEIKETKAPDGYILKGDSTFYIKVTSSGIQLVIRDDSKAPDEWETAAGNNGAVTYVADSRTATVVNEPGAALPSTGGPGTRLFMILGSMLSLGAGLLLWRRRRLI